MKRILASLLVALTLSLSLPPIELKAQTPAFSPAAIVNILNEVKSANPRAWDHAHVFNDAERYDFIICAVQRLYADSNGTVGGNWRRANRGDLSADGLSIKATDGRFYFVDIIVAAKDDINSPWTPSLIGNIRLNSDDLLRNTAGEYAPWGFVHANELPAPAQPCQSGNGGGGVPTTTTSIGLSWFPALGLYHHDRARYNESLAFIRDARIFDYVRVFYYLGGEPWTIVGTEHRTDAERRATLVRVVEDLLAIGVKPQITVFGTWVADANRRNDLLQQFKNTIRPYNTRLFLVDCYNEPGAIGVPEYGYVRDCGRELANEGYPMLSLASPDSLHIGVGGRTATDAEVIADTQRLYGAMPGGINAITPHWQRSPWMPNRRLGVNLYVVNDEPRGFKSSGAEIRDPADFRRDYALDKTARVVGYTLHTEPGVWAGYCNPRWPDNNEYPTFGSIPRIDGIIAALKAEKSGDSNSGGGSTTFPQPYPSEQDWWPAYEADVAALYQRAFNEGKRDTPNPDWAALRWFSRMGHSSAHDDLARARDKHLNELAAALGVSR